jgi:hypothetical protein
MPVVKSLSWRLRVPRLPPARKNQKPLFIGYQIQCLSRSASMNDCKLSYLIGW